MTFIFFSLPFSTSLENLKTLNEHYCSHGNVFVFINPKRIYSLIKLGSNYLRNLHRPLKATPDGNCVAWLLCPEGLTEAQTEYSL